MTSGLSNYAMENALNFKLRNTAWTPPSTIYAGLDSAISNAANGGTEISAGGYARQAASVGSFTSRQVSNDASNTWTPSETWPEAVGFRLWDAPTGGNALGWGALSPRPTPSTIAPFTLAVGEMVITCDATYTNLSTWALGELLKLIFDNTAGSSWSGGIYAHLVNVRSSIAFSGGTAVSGTGYPGGQAASFAAWASGRNYLASDITYANPTSAAWTNANGVEFTTSATYGSGNLIASGDLSPARSIGAGVPVVLKTSSTFIGVGGAI